MQRTRRMGRYISAETCAKLQNNPECIRNICILAHVDHGKTSLSDSLLASNGIISTKLAGKVRYLDSRPDEQLRGITMESSAISLYFRVLRKKEQGKEPQDNHEDKSKESTPGSENVTVNEHLINLIDSPGHIDFSSEVSAASRLCDGAVVLVDVVEGVCSQTVTVLRQCWTGNLKPILVLNKLDRLIIELQLDPLEAYNHLHRIIEQVNSVLGSFYTGDRALQDLSWRENLEQGNVSDFVEKDDSDLYFHPENNNVIFASAIDGWGFNVGQIAKFYESKLGINREKLSKVLWGDYFYENKTKKILTRKALNGKNLKPLFVSFILDNIWRVYETVLGEFNDDFDHHHELDVAKLEKITKVLNVQLLPRDLRTKDYKNLLRNIMNQWLPVSTAVLLTAIEKLPSPKESQKKRLDAILEFTPNSDLLDKKLRASMEQCDSNGPVAAYVSKILSIPREELPVKSSIHRDPSAVENDLFERARKAREEALKAGKNAEFTEKLVHASTDSNKPAKTFRKRGEDIYKRAEESTITPDIDELELNAKLAKKKQISIQLSESTPTTQARNDEFKIVTAPAPEFDLGFEYETEGQEIEEKNEEKNEDAESEEDDGEDNEDFEIPEYIPTLDPNDPFSELFEYEDEDPFGNYEEDEDDENDNDSGEEVLIGFARIYSGTLKVGQEIQVLEPKYSPLRPKDFIHTTTITELYLFMGKELIPLDEVPAGNIVGIGGLAGKILKNGTLIETGFQGVNLAGSSLHSQPIVRVALEPSNPTKMGRMVKGLRLLNQADPCVETFVNDHGEHILCTAGELHLERCLKDLTERFARIDITHSDPVIPYRETFLETDDMNPTKNSEGQRGEVKFYLGKYRVELSTSPLKEETVKYIIQNENKIKLMNAKGFVDEKFKLKLTELLTPESVNNIVGFGGKRCGPNILVSEGGLLSKYFAPSSKASCLFADSIVNGFQLSCQEGPLCKEEVQGMLVVIKDVHEMTAEEIANVGIENYQVEIPDLSGRFITSTRQAIHQSFLDWSPRVMWAMYSCDIQASVDVLGKVYAVVQKRRGKIVSEELKEGTPFFEIEARVPVVEAFGFSEDIRKKTSGAAQPQLVFSGFEPIDLDPFWVPTTEEELEELGEFAERENIARRHMNTIRKRKGLLVDEKVVENAEKQRTLKKD